MALCILPIEISHTIACLLETDRDVCNYIAVCRQTYGAVGNEQSHIWRKRFKQQYDLLPNKSTGELARRYKLRRRVLRMGTIFSFGHEFQERLCLDIIRELITESFGQTSQTSASELKPCSKNLKVLQRFIRSTNLLDNVFRYAPEKGIYNPLLTAIQLLLTPWTLDHELAFQTYSFAYSQKAVYGRPKDYPMFLDKHRRLVNVEYLLHTANFFKYHMIRSEEHTLFQDVWALEEDEKPRVWAEKLEDGTKQLGKYWMGSYAFPEDPIELIRNSEPSDHVFIDVFENEEGFQTMELNFNTSDPVSRTGASEKSMASIFPFSPSLNAYMNNLTGRKANEVEQLSSEYSRTKSDYLSFEGSGYDRDHFHCAGHLHALTAQHGIPGWQRITLMKYALDPYGFYDPGSCWAYEGIVLPGRHIILGRWWSPLSSGGDHDICGPFIFWNVRKVDGDGGLLTPEGSESEQDH